MRNSFLVSVGFALIVFAQTACAEAILPGKASKATPNEGATPASFETKPLEACFAPYEPCDKKIIEFINGAHKQLDIAIYSITHPEIVAAIKDAFKKGLQVRMVVDRTQAAGNSSLVDDLVAAGVPLKIGDTGRAIMHNKFTIVDGVALETGSYNYTKNASFENSENQIYIHDLKIIERYKNDFENLWQKGLAPRPPEPSQTQSQGQGVLDFN